MSAATSNRSSATSSSLRSTMTRERLRKEVAAKAELHAEERVLDALVGANAGKDTREKFRRLLREGALADKEIELEVADRGGGTCRPSTSRACRARRWACSISATSSARRSASAPSASA